MKALQVTQPRSFRVVQVANPVLDQNRRNYLLVKTSWVMMCGSDMPFFCGRKPNLPYPLQSGFPAHECAGEVVQSSSADFQPGDRVVAMPEQSRGLAEYFLAPAEKAVRLSDSLSDQAASCLIQPLATVINAIDRLGDIRDSTITIVGLGSIGILFSWLLKKQGASRIVGIDPIPFRCETALKFGADQTFASTSGRYVEETPLKMMEYPDICIEAVGHQMQTINDCIKIVKKNGTILAFGVPDQDVYSIDYEVFFRKNACLKAVVTPDWKEYLKRAHDLFLEQEERLSRLVTHTFSIDEAEQAYKSYEAHTNGILKAGIDLTRWEKNNGFNKKR